MAVSAEPPDLGNLVGSCATCRRESLPSSAFYELHLRRFLAERTTSRGFKDVRDQARAAATLQVAGESLSCRACIDEESKRIAAADTVWDADISGATVAAAPPSQQHHQVDVVEDDDVPDSWDD